MTFAMSACKDEIIYSTLITSALWCIILILWSVVLIHYKNLRKNSLSGGHDSLGKTYDKSDDLDTSDPMTDFMNQIDHKLSKMTDLMKNSVPPPSSPQSARSGRSAQSAPSPRSPVAPQSQKQMQRQVTATASQAPLSFATMAIASASYSATTPTRDPVQGLKFPHQLCLSHSNTNTAGYNNLRSNSLPRTNSGHGGSGGAHVLPVISSVNVEGLNTNMTNMTNMVTNMESLESIQAAQESLHLQQTGGQRVQAVQAGQTAPVRVESRQVTQATQLQAIQAIQTMQTIHGLDSQGINYVGQRTKQVDNIMSTTTQSQQSHQSLGLSRSVSPSHYTGPIMFPVRLQNGNVSFHHNITQIRTGDGAQVIISQPLSNTQNSHTSHTSHTNAHTSHTPHSLNNNYSNYNQNDNNNNNNNYEHGHSHNVDNSVNNNNNNSINNNNSNNNKNNVNSKHNSPLHLPTINDDSSLNDTYNSLPYLDDMVKSTQLHVINSSGNNSNDDNGGGSGGSGSGSGSDSNGQRSSILSTATMTVTQTQTQSIDYGESTMDTDGEKENRESLRHVDEDESISQGNDFSFITTITNDQTVIEASFQSNSNNNNNNNHNNIHNNNNNNNNNNNEKSSQNDEETSTVFSGHTQTKTSKTSANNRNKVNQRKKTNSKNINDSIVNIRYSYVETGTNGPTSLGQPLS